jgi:hypothetical protein
MNIESLTIGEAREIAAIFQGTQNSESTMLKNYIGKYVLCRSRSEGINAGTVKDIDSTGVVISDARRLWYHKPSTNDAWYEGVAKHGLSSDSKISIENEKVIVEDYSLTVCSEDAKKSIESHNNYQV